MAGLATVVSEASEVAAAALAVMFQTSRIAGTEDFNPATVEAVAEVESAAMVQTVAFLFTIKAV